MAVTTCYPCPCPLGGSQPINPLALGDRWLVYADKKLHPSKRSSGGCEGEGVTSYTATVLHAAKSLSKGLRGLGESVAHSLAGGRSTSQSPSPPNSDTQQAGVVTILDIEGNEYDDGQDSEEPYDPIVAHFLAHSEAIIALKFDASGMLLVTADRRGHDFHVFRINPHPCGPSLASVHHLYILHRGDTTAKVQDIAISPDSRWTAITTLRGTTHVFAISPYGGACGVRTHTQPRVVNRLSRFQRSAGLPIHAQPPRSGSPVSECLGQGAWFPNPRLPPYPLPCLCSPLAQLRPTANLPTRTITRTSSGRQRLSSQSEDCNSAPLPARARFGLSVCSAATPRAPAMPALYLVTHTGGLLHLVLHARPAKSIPKEKVCDESPIEVEVEHVAQWALARPPPPAPDLLAPLPPTSPLLQPIGNKLICADMCMSEEERWLSQVEIVTHAGPHRRLWMGPQFIFKTYNTTGSNSSLSEAEAVEVDTSAAGSVARSNPVNMPGVRPVVPVMVDSGSASSLEHSPSDSFRRKSLLADSGRASVCDVQLREDLAEAMKEDHGWPREREREREREEARAARRSGCASAGAGVRRAVDPLGTVVPRAEPEPGPEPADPDLYTQANADEGRFRPVVRAPAALSLPAHVIARPLPRDTTIPVQTVAPRAHLTPDDEPVPLNTAVVHPRGAHASAPVRDAGFVPVEPARRRDLVPADAVHVKPDVDIGLERENDVWKREDPRVSSAPAERESDKESLPKSNRASDDIQPIARARVKKSPTPKSVSDRDSEVIKEKPRDIKEREKNIEGASRDTRNECKPKEPRVPRKMEVEPEVVVVDNEKDKRAVSVVKEEAPVTNAFAVDVEDTRTKSKHLDKSEKSKVTEDNRDKSKKEDKNETPPKDSRDRSKKSDKADNIKGATEVIYDKVKKGNQIDPVKSGIDEGREKIKKVENIKPVTKEFSEKLIKVEHTDVAKAEEQAWDLLFSETERPAVLNVTQQTIVTDKFDEKPKSKKTRKGRKGQEDQQAKDDEDSFIEIHAIDEAKTPSCGELVSISTPFEDIDATNSYLAKLKKLSSKSVTSEKDDETEVKPIECFPEDDYELASLKLKSRKNSSVSSYIEGWPEPSPVKKSTPLPIEKPPSSHLKVKQDVLSTSENLCTSPKDVPKTKKSKSLSPYSDASRKHGDKAFESEKKDVYIIDSSKDEFPEIQITRGTKTRKSPQPIERKCAEKEILQDRPIKSWSSIAATKNDKRDEPTMALKKYERRDSWEEPHVGTSLDYPKSHKDDRVSLQDKLIELCKRTDIMVAECDAPNELNFVEEHHTDLHDLPPLEPLDFGLDDYKLEVMRDSLLEVNDTKITSPICKINIDDILSSIKETTSKVIESSTFNLVDLEKVPARKEKGFSVIESHKITTQEVKIDDESKEGESSTMEKSSDDDNVSPLASTDSDKEDKRTTGPASVLLPSAKQPSKCKKSRRKKK
ncbi:uncharacterized protein LOC125228918 isoform X2 [Leguminivora glycinivorella]|nr:uncharacterized protein LOC125228918 isoform X2 [Leguminivora glycinivorella]